ncbi:hypothetical protein [Puniceibacterium sediminis]|uniref:Uncharacterized protein n=1 Tax=Puniceibacterium sediminis TaxID=1608407 RepID=A0A238YVW4_9RHOB|nr:hypothetical protein [Puniceibacterium sediminis]SNR74938.1 hypothetical protein SAMN06265370_12041 [Puniceibacterium sediminis]
MPGQMINVVWYQSDRLYLSIDRSLVGLAPSNSEFAFIFVAHCGRGQQMVMESEKLIGATCLKSGQHAVQSILVIPAACQYVEVLRVDFEHEQYVPLQMIHLKSGGMPAAESNPIQAIFKFNNNTQPAGKIEFHGSRAVPEIKSPYIAWRSIHRQNIVANPNGVNIFSIGTGAVDYPTATASLSVEPLGFERWSEDAPQHSSVQAIASRDRVRSVDFIISCASEDGVQDVLENVYLIHVHRMAQQYRDWLPETGLNDEQRQDLFRVFERRFLEVVATSADIAKSEGVEDVNDDIEAMRDTLVDSLERITRDGLRYETLQGGHDMWMWVAAPIDDSTLELRVTNVSVQDFLVLYDAKRRSLSVVGDGPPLPDGFAAFRVDHGSCEPLNIGEFDVMETVAEIAVNAAPSSANRARELIRPHPALIPWFEARNIPEKDHDPQGYVILEAEVYGNLEPRVAPKWENFSKSPAVGAMLAHVFEAPPASGEPGGQTGFVAAVLKELGAHVEDLPRMQDQLAALASLLACKDDKHFHKAVSTIEDLDLHQGPHNLHEVIRILNGDEVKAEGSEQGSSDIYSLEEYRKRYQAERHARKEEEKTAIWVQDILTSTHGNSADPADGSETDFTNLVRTLESLVGHEKMSAEDKHMVEKLLAEVKSEKFAKSKSAVVAEEVEKRFPRATYPSVATEVLKAVRVALIQVDAKGLDETRVVAVGKRIFEAYYRKPQWRANTLTDRAKVAGEKVHGMILTATFGGPEAIDGWWHARCGIEAIVMADDYERCAAALEDENLPEVTKAKILRRLHIWPVDASRTVAFVDAVLSDWRAAAPETAHV